MTPHDTKTPDPIGKITTNLLAACDNAKRLESLPLNGLFHEVLSSDVGDYQCVVELMNRLWPEWVKEEDAVFEHGAPPKEPLTAASQRIAELEAKLSKCLKESGELCDTANAFNDERNDLQVKVAGMELALSSFRARLLLADRMAEALEWRDIASAPRDGSEILGYREDCGAVLMRWAAPCDFLNERELEGVKDADEPDWFCADFICGAYRISNDGQPTHWLPIPQFAAYRAAKETKLP